MRGTYVELEPRSSGKRSSDEGPSWTGEVPAATRDQHLKTDLALGTSSTTTVHKGLRGRPGREVGMSLTYDGHLSMVGPVVPQSPQGCAECLPTGSLSSKRFSPVKTGVGATSTKH